MGNLLNSRDIIMCFCTNAGIELYNNLTALKRKILMFCTYMKNIQTI